MGQKRTPNSEETSPRGAGAFFSVWGYPQDNKAKAHEASQSAGPDANSPGTDDLECPTMATDGSGEVVVTESQLVWREVKECLSSEDFDKAVQLCNTGEAREYSYLCLLVLWHRRDKRALAPAHSGRRRMHEAPLLFQRNAC